MYFIYDNLTATLVGGTVLLILLAMQVRLTHSSVKRTATYMTKKQALEFADWLEDDLLKTGTNMKMNSQECEDAGNNCLAFENPYVEDGITREFVFYHKMPGCDNEYVKLENCAEADKEINNVETKYDLVETSETRKIDGEEKALYRLVRKQKRWGVDGEPKPTSYRDAGESAGLLQYFSIKMLDSDGDVVSNPSQVYKNNPNSVEHIRLKFAMALPFEGDMGLNALHWGSSLLLRQ